MACISIPTALLVSGGLSAGASVLGGLSSASAAKKAAATQAEAAKQASANTMKMFGDVSGNFSPYMSAGVNALGGVQNLLGLGPNGNDGIMEQLRKMPGYQFALEQGLQATQNGFAAKGLGSSGAAMKGAANYVEGLAGQGYNALFGNMFQTAGLGANAAGNLGTLGMSAVNASSNYLTGGAAATAGGIVGANNALMGGLGGAVNGISGGLTNYAMAPYMMNMFGGGPGAPAPNASSGMYMAGGGATPVTDNILSNWKMYGG